MGKHSARADRAPRGSAAAAAPGTGRRRAPDGGPAVHGRANPGAASAVPGPGPGRRRGGTSGVEAAELAADFDAGFGPDYDAGYTAGLGSGSGSGSGPGFGQEETARPSARGGHPEQRDAVLGWGVIGAQRAQAAGAAPAVPAGHTHFTTGFMPGGTTPGAAGGSSDGSDDAVTHTRVPMPGGVSGRNVTAGDGSRRAGTAGASRVPGRRVARTVTGVAAALVTAVLAVTVAGQVQESADGKAQAHSADVGKRPEADIASRSDSRPTPNGGAEVPVTYEQKMAKKYPLEAQAGASGEFEAVGGEDKAPGKGDVLRYRVDVEKGLPLDGALFAEAVHRTLNDERSWGHGERRTFERVSSGDTDFVVTLASPRTTATWCAKSGLDTTEDNVSCDSAATDRVMINAYRWAQGSQTYGDEMHAYRQMLINHEVGHRLGHDHESCSAQDALAPVMMQQTKFLTTDGRTCRPNAWPFPGPDPRPTS
ncbi:DUF3152 domain-containing protein [Streptomyces sp. NPDC026206]|uniref:DUF3152 domain-containing protein n=1 Tax=Streptomyces sp. NPDC026206 TaxID=3157089 RepID=UPI003400B3EB